jgi:hypothetical protein
LLLLFKLELGGEVTCWWRSGCLGILHKSEDARASPEVTTCPPGMNEAVKPEKVVPLPRFCWNLPLGFTPRSQLLPHPFLQLRTHTSPSRWWPLASRRLSPQSSQPGALLLLYSQDLEGRKWRSGTEQLDY